MKVRSAQNETEVKKAERFNLTGVFLIGLAFCMLMALLVRVQGKLSYSVRKENLSLLPKEELIARKSKTPAPKEKECLLVTEDHDPMAQIAGPYMETIFKQMKIGYDTCFADHLNRAQMDQYGKIILAVTNYQMLTDALAELPAWVNAGGHLMILFPPENNGSFQSLAALLGIKESADFELVERIHFCSDFMLGGTAHDFPIDDAYESSLALTLKKDCEVFLNSGGEYPIPLLWRRTAGKGTVVFDNLGIMEKSYRGFHWAAYSLLSDYCVYPVINGATFYIDDFPAPVPEGDSQYIMMSKKMLDIQIQICEEDFTYTAFSDFFHTVRSMFLPLLYLLRTDMPRADVYHSIATGYGGVLARLGSWKYHVPYLITEHGIYTREREEEIIRANWVLPAFKKFWVRFFYMLSNAAYEKASMVSSLFAGARSIQIDIGCDPDKCVYIGNGVHFERFQNIGPKEPNGYVDIGAFLRIAPIKDVKSMIYAFSGLKEKVPNARLFIAGPEDDPVYAKECRDLVERLQVRDLSFLGTVDVVKEMVRFDFTILSSISEGMPLTVLESFAAGRPCVTTDVGSCRELLTKAAPDDEFGSAGICVPPMEIQELTNAMAVLCSNPEKRARMGYAGRKRVEKYFLHEEMIRKYLELYDEVFRRWRESDLA